MHSLFSTNPNFNSFTSVKVDQFTNNEQLSFIIKEHPEFFNIDGSLCRNYQVPINNDPSPCSNYQNSSDNELLDDNLAKQIFEFKTTIQDLEYQMENIRIPENRKHFLGAFEQLQTTIFEMELQLLRRNVGNAAKQLHSKLHPKYDIQRVEDEVDSYDDNESYESTVAKEESGCCCPKTPHSNLIRGFISNGSSIFTFFKETSYERDFPDFPDSKGLEVYIDSNTILKLNGNTFALNDDPDVQDVPVVPFTIPAGSPVGDGMGCSFITSHPTKCSAKRVIISAGTSLYLNGNALEFKDDHTFEIVLTNTNQKQEVEPGPDSNSESELTAILAEMHQYSELVEVKLESVEPRFQVQLIELEQ